jgi:hypothetical protein
MEERKEFLLKHFNFTCNCVACQNPQKYSSIYSPFGFTNFQWKDPNYFALRDLQEASKIFLQADVEVAVSGYPLLCQYLNKNDKNFPSQELMQTDFCMEKCLKVFTINNVFDETEAQKMSQLNEL